MPALRCDPIMHAVSNRLFVPSTMRLAARLARKRDYRFCFVLPQGDNLFMQGLAREISVHAAHLSAERVAVDTQYTDVFDADTLARALRGLAGYDGVACVAVDDPRVREAINALESGGVCVVTLVSDVPSSARGHFVGIDNAAAGRTAATLLGRFTAGKAGHVAVIAGSLALRDHAERLFGFSKVIKAEHSALRLLAVEEGRDKAAPTAAIVRRLLAQHADLVALYNLGAGTTGVIEALREAGRASALTVVVHELNEDSRAALLDGTLDAVISQDAGHEARSALRVLMARADRQPIIAAQERIGIDIFVRDNLP
jgi:LacI family transcriptional regulator